MSTPKPRHSNRLQHETSPYLRQHAHNPVDWYPWGEEALKRAKREEKPIFLSIGYSACHWCHVMERESFEDESTAALMNEHFVNVKVDREERQDLDHIYMSAVQVMTQHGGWPMSVFLTPGLEPFYGGTYFPPEDRHGMPSFKKILVGVSSAWRTRRKEVEESAKQLTGALDEINRAVLVGQTPNPLAPELFDNAFRAIAGAFDSRYGGLGQAPKFFHSMSLRLCLRQFKRTGERAALAVVTGTLDHILRGGIYDHLGGGFHRYSTDQRWLAPHFEKMLYDNALLVPLFLEAFQTTGEPEYERTARETLDWTLREMIAPDGGFCSTLDADTEGEEGKFYVWSDEQVRRLLDGELAELFRHVYDVTPEGNWEGKNILHRVMEVEEATKRFGNDRDWVEEHLALARRKLYSERAQRPAPFRDEKVLVAWNGLMIDALAKGHQVLGDDRYLDAARAAASFLLEKVTRRESDRLYLLHTWKDGHARLNAYLDDYANFVDGLVSLYESDFDLRWLEAATALADTLLDEFWDAAEAGFFFTGRSHEKLITRVKDVNDGAMPSGTAMAVTGLLRLARLTGRDEYLKKAERTLQRYEPMLRLAPTSTSQMLTALGFLIDRPQELVLMPGVTSDENESALQEIRRRFLPNKVVASLAAGAARAEAEKLVPLLRDRRARDEQATLYVCEGFTCRAPAVGTEKIVEALG